MNCAFQAESYKFSFMSSNSFIAFFSCPKAFTPIIGLVAIIQTGRVIMQIKVKSGLIVSIIIVIPTIVTTADIS